jgi:hypothetical protein
MSALGSLVVKLALEYAEYTKGLGKSEQDALKFAQNVQKGFDQASAKTDEAIGKVVKGAAAFAAAFVSVNAVMDQLNHSIDTLGRLDDMAQKTGSSVETLSKMQKVAVAFGANIDSVDTSISRLAKGMATVDDDTNKTQKALAALGVSSKDSARKMREPAQVFIDVAKRLQEYRDGAAKAALVTDLFGKSGADLLPYLNDLAENVDKFSSVSAEAAKRGADFQDNLGRMRVKSEELWETIALGTLPAMNDFVTALTDVRNAKDGLTEDDVSQWADDAAVGLARVVDVALLLPKVFGAVSGSFKAVAADIHAAAVLAENANPIKAAYKALTGGDPLQEIRDAVAARNKVLEEANQKYDDLWNKPANLMEQAVLKRLADRPKDASSAGGNSPEQKVLDYTTGNDKEKAKQAEEYAKLVSAIGAKIEVSKLELAIDQDATESQKARIKLDQELAAGKVKLTADQRGSVDVMLAEWEAIEQNIKARQMEKEVLDQMQQSAQARNAANDSLAAEYALYGKSADAREIAMVKVKAEAALEKYLFDVRRSGKPITDEMIAQLRAETAMRVEAEQATLAQTKALGYANQLAEENKRFGAEAIFDDKDRAAALLRIDAETWQERIELAGDGTEAQKALQTQYDIWYRNQLLKPQLDADRQMWASIDQTAHETFVSIFDSGKSAFDRLEDTLKNGLYDLLYQITVKQWIIDIGASVSSSGMSGMATGAAMSGASSAGGSMAGAALGSMFGAGGLSGSMLAGAGWLTGSTTLAGSLGAAGSLIGTGTAAGAMSGLGMAAGALGPIALGVAALYSLSKSLDHSGTPHTGGAAASSYGHTSVIAAESLHFEKTATSAGTEKFVSGVASSIASILDSTAASFGQKAGYAVATAFADDSSKDGAWGGLVINKAGDSPLSMEKVLDWQDSRGNGPWAPKVFADGEAGQQQYLAEVSKSVRAALDQIGLPGWATKMLDDLGDAPALDDLAKTVDAINATQSALTLMGQHLAGFADLSDSAVSKLIAAAGGIDALAASAGAYYDDFYSEGEKAVAMSGQLEEAFKKASLQMPATRAEFRALFEAQMKLGDAGAGNVAMLLSVEHAFAELHPELEDTAGAIKTVSGARDALTEAYQREQDAIKATSDRMSSFATNLRNLHDSALLGSLSPLTPKEKYAEAKSQYERTLAAARGGDTAAQAHYQDAYTAFLQASQVANASGDQYQRDFAYAQAATEEAIDWAEQQVDIAQASLDALNAQVDGLIDVKDEVTTVTEAIDALAEAMGGSGSAALQQSQSSAIQSLYEEMLGRAPDAAGTQFWQQRLSGGMSIGDMAKAISQSDEYRSSPSGSTLMAAPIDYSAIGTSNMVPLVEAIKKLTADNQALKDQVEGLRADAAEQTGDLMQALAAASSSNAEKIAAAAADAIKAAGQTRETRVNPQ